MTALERGESFVRDIAELNTNMVSECLEVQRESFETLLEAGRHWFAALRQVQDLSDVVEAQREYYAAVQENAQDSFERREHLVRQSVEAAQQLIRRLFTST